LKIFPNKTFGNAEVGFVADGVPFTRLNYRYVSLMYRYLNAITTYTELWLQFAFTQCCIGATNLFVLSYTSESVFVLGGIQI